MSKAIPGFPYTIFPGDTLIGIAKQAYGNPKRWRDIWKANKNNARTDDPNNSFWPGDIINIPKDEDKEKLLNDLLGPDIPRLLDKDPDDFTLVIDDTEIPVIAGRAWKSIDSVAYGWSATIHWNHENEKLANLLKPFRYQRAQCYLGGMLVCDGILYFMENSFSPGGIYKVMEGASYTADLIDSTIKPPYEANNITLENRIKDLVAPFSISVVLSDTLGTKLLDLAKPFKRVTVQPEDVVFDHLAKLAFERGVLLNTNPLGELVVTVANNRAKPVCTIEEGLPPFSDATLTFDGRKRFNVYNAIGTSPGRKNKRNKNSKSAIAKDEIVTRPRFTTFNVDNTEVGDIQTAANWQRSKQIIEALTFDLPVSSWYDKNQNMWDCNTRVTVVAPSLHIYDGFTFLIRSVEYIFEETGMRSILSLVPPQAYTGEEITEPWGIPEKGFLESLLERV